MLVLRRREQGDTLIEVLLAFSIFSAIVAGAIVIMNQGISSAQNSLEISLVRNQIDTQAELLRHFNNGKLTAVGRAESDASRQWAEAIQGATTAGAQPYDEIATTEQCVPSNLPSGAFFIDPRGGRVVRDATRFKPTETFAQVQDPGGVEGMISNMLWVEAVRSPDDLRLKDTLYYDFHIRACWESSSVGTDVMKLGTIVRLYVPKE